jgi:hypothetical protein
VINGGNVTNANYMFAGDKALAVYRFLASLDDYMPAAMAVNIGSMVAPGTDQIGLVVNLNLAGEPGDAAVYLAGLSQLGPLRSEVLNVRWRDVFATSYFGIPDTKACGRNQHVNMRSVGAQHTDPDALVDFLGQLERFTAAHPDVQTAMMIHRFATDGALTVPDEDSVYPHRSLKLHMWVFFSFCAH